MASESSNLWRSIPDDPPPFGETVLLGRPLDFPSRQGIYCVATRRDNGYECDECGERTSDDFTHWMYPPGFQQDQGNKP